MPTARKPKITSRHFSQEEIATAIAAAPPDTGPERTIDWSKGVVTRGGGVAATIAAIKRARGPGKKPPKEQVAIRLDPEVLAAFRAGGAGWQTRVNAALKDWLASNSIKRGTRPKAAA